MLSTPGIPQKRMGEEEDIFFCDECDGIFLSTEKLIDHQNKLHKSPSTEEVINNKCNFVIMSKLFWMKYNTGFLCPW